VHTLSVGASCPQDFDAHVEALEHYDNPGSLIDPIADRIDQAMEKALGRDWWRGWWKGIPSWEKLPGQMNLFYAIRLWNWAKGLGMIEFAQSRYNMLGNASHWVAGQNLAALPQHDLLPYLQDSPFAARLIAEAREAHEALFNPDAPAG
jgi:predicted aldo/keto reductase-like oxidoreductase